MKKPVTIKSFLLSFGTFTITYLGLRFISEIIKNNHFSPGYLAGTAIGVAIVYGILFQLVCMKFKIIG
jgi:hypothetical protein